MNIELNDNVRMLTAIGKVSEGKYFDALCLFARVDSYESMLNQIGCLCHLSDTGYAVELYRRLLAKYYLTHNCFSDLKRVSAQTVDLLSFFDSALKKDEFDEDKISCDVNLIADFTRSEEDSAYDDFYDEYEDIPFDSGLCDVHSTEYFFRMIQRVQDESEKGNLKKAEKIIKELMEFESDDEAVLEGQMLLCLAERNFENGSKFAEKFAALEHCDSYRGTAVAVALLSGSNKHKETLHKMLNRMLEFADEIADSDLMEYAEIAEGSFETDEVTARFAELLVSRHKHIGCEALRVAARIFCNMGLKKQARDAILTLLSAAPWDSYATVMLMFVDSGIDAKLDKAFTNINLVRHLDVPSQFAVIAEYNLIQRMEKSMKTGEPCILTGDDYKLLHCIANVCKTHVYRGNSEKFVNDATVLATILTTFEPQNKTEFFEFAGQQLCSFMPEAPVQKDILLRLINLGYRDKVLISVEKGYYALDLSKLTLNDEKFLDAFSLCAVLRRVDVRKLQRSYAKIKKLVDFNEITKDDAVYDEVHQLAYCMLAISYKDFVESTVADYFSNGEDLLYFVYLDHLAREKAKKLKK